MRQTLKISIALYLQIVVESGQRIEIIAYKFTALPEDTDELIESYTDPCKHTLIFIDGSEMHEVSKSHVVPMFTN